MAFAEFWWVILKAAAMVAVLMLAVRGILRVLR